MKKTITIQDGFLSRPIVHQITIKVENKLSTVASFIKARINKEIEKIIVNLWGYYQKFVQTTETT